MVWFLLPCVFRAKPTMLKRFRRLLHLLLGLLCLCPLSIRAEELAATDGLKPFVGWLLNDGERLEAVRFAEVVEAVAQVRVLPVVAERAEDTVLLSAIQESADRMLAALQDTEHPVHQSGRINETSRYIESYLREALNAVEGLRCTIPMTAAGEVQLSGYPDLRVEHVASGRVFYLDPKVYRDGSEQSSFRTFYFEPKRETNKILDEASHLILGVAHRGRSDDGRWQFTRWQLVDLAAFEVRLKAEFQASNRDLYRDEAVLLRSAAASSGESATEESRIE